MKTCSKCKEEKELDNFPKNKLKIDGYHYQCKLCVKNTSKKYYQNNKEKKIKYLKQYQNISKDQIKKYQQSWYLDNKENLKNEYKSEKENRLLYQKEYYQNNKEKRNEYSKHYNKNRYNRDIEFRLSISLRTRIIAALKGNFKGDKTLKLLGCTIEDFKLHLEKQFLPEMNWENHGIVWEIDHIKPCASFDLTDVNQQKECFHYVNQYPLFKTTDIAKSFGYNELIGNRNKFKNKLLK
jgi:hypothetical protein